MTVFQAALPAWTVLLPLIGAIAAWQLPYRMAVASALGAAGLTLTTIISLGFAVWSSGSVVHEVGGYPAPLGIELVADGLSVWMLLLSAIVNAAVGVYAALYFSREERSFWPLWLLLWGGLNALAQSADLFNLYVTLEVVSLSAVALVTLSKGATALTAAIRYLLAAMFGSLCYLLGVTLLYAEYGVLDLPSLALLLSPGPLTGLALVLLTLGLLLKTAIFPFHFWLPLAHASARAPVSALLSALVVKAAFYLLLRLWLYVFTGLPLEIPAQFLGALGATAVAYGSIQALRQARLKLLVAYSTVAQLGYLMLAIPLIVGTLPEVRALAYQGVAYHMMSHALVKAALFLAAGVVMKCYGHDRIRELQGMASRLPLTTFVIALAAASLTGLPPSGGFIAKWWLVSAAIQGGQLGWGLALLLGGLLSALYMFRLIAIGMPRGELGGRPERGDDAAREPLRLALPAFLLAVGAIGIGLRAIELIELLHVGAPFDLFGGTA